MEPPPARQQCTALGAELRLPVTHPDPCFTEAAGPVGAGRTLCVLGPISGGQKSQGFLPLAPQVGAPEESGAQVESLRPGLRRQGLQRREEAQWRRRLGGRRDGQERRWPQLAACALPFFTRGEHCGGAGVRVGELMHTRTRVRINVDMRAHTCMCVHTHEQAHMNLRTLTNTVCTRALTCAHAYSCTDTCPHTHLGTLGHADSTEPSG